MIVFGESLKILFLSVSTQASQPKAEPHGCRQRHSQTVAENAANNMTSYAVRLDHRFNLSHSDIEDILAEHGIVVSREAIRQWCNKFGWLYARRLKRKHQGCGDTVLHR
jgi:hypothetical protein